MSFLGSNTTAGAKLINWPGIRANLMQGAREGLEMALDQCVRDAKEKAPVRDVFAGGSHGRAGLKKILMASGKPGSARMGSELLLNERGTKIYRHTAEAQQEFMEAVKAQSLPRHKYTVASVSKYGLDSKTSFTTHHRDMDPVLVDPAGTPRRAEYGFRDISGFVPGKGLAGLPQQRIVGPPSLREPAVGSDRPALVQRQSVEEYLSVKGRAEVMRASRLTSLSSGLNAWSQSHNFNPNIGGLKRSSGPGLPSGRYSSLGNSAIHRTATGDMTLGGRLRDEIYRTGTRMTSHTISGWVVSPTPYAKYQEWGTSRHRPQPYMRPALYKARENLPRLVKVHLGRKNR